MAHKTYIREVEGGKNAVLFIHGFLGSTEHFEDFLPMIPDDYGIYNILLDGHGGSVKDFSYTSMEKWKNQVSGIVKEMVEKYDDIIIVAHSMGTFFAMDEAIKYPEHIKGIMLLQSPLKIGVKLSACVNSIKSLFNLISDDDEFGKAYQNSHSVKLNLRIWEYIGWIPRYLELFRESVRARKLICKVDVPCYIFQSAKDELVSIKSLKFVPEKKNISLHILEKSYHFIYNKDDKEILFDSFRKILI